MPLVPFGDDSSITTSAPQKSRSSMGLSELTGSSNPISPARDASKKQQQKCDNGDQPRLLHSSLLKIPQSIRFLLAGALNNILFILVLGISTAAFEDKHDPSFIYTVVSVMMIPVGHASTCLFVFGWPSPYLTSLLSTAPIGLIGTALGAGLTGFLDKYHFDKRIHEHASFWFPLLIEETTNKKGHEGHEHIPNTYSSIVVLAVVGIFSYVASSWIMGGNEESKKESKQE